MSDTIKLLDVTALVGNIPERQVVHGQVEMVLKRIGIVIFEIGSVTTPTSINSKFEFYPWLIEN